MKSTFLKQQQDTIRAKLDNRGHVLLDIISLKERPTNIPDVKTLSVITWWQSALHLSMLTVILWPNGWKQTPHPAYTLLLPSLLLILQTPAPATPAPWPQHAIPAHHAPALHMSYRQMSPSPSLETCSPLSPSINSNLPSSVLVPFSLHTFDSNLLGTALLFIFFQHLFKLGSPQLASLRARPMSNSHLCPALCSCTVTLVSISTPTAMLQLETYYFWMFNKWDYLNNQKTKTEDFSSWNILIRDVFHNELWDQQDPA